ncbi:hypothetical protein D9615_002815 [Tricholomella constricta]|uniref:Phytochrome n=1 Tax=Tricholomella constricta TaxID=117010 RepID=A0A8H5HG86_9AGAR|nr:hypothetical protein D9615_002815 [Tricholomella constricta]
MSEKTFLERARLGLVIFGGLYVGLVGLLATPYFQSHVLYLNAVRLPFFAKFDIPEKYGLAPNKTLNFNIRTADNEILGAWFVLSDQYYQSLPEIPSALDTHIPVTLKRHPTILFFHGNAATRAFKARILHYEAYSSRLGANVLAIDYRGFADSTGKPSEPGLVRDARAAWDWLLAQGAKEEDILLVGHSLGTGVVSQLAAQLSDEGSKSRGVVLLSPFSSIREVLNTYHIFGAVPLMKPLAMIPYVPEMVTWALTHKFDSLSAVPRIKGSVLISHAEDDWDIPFTHSQVLFDAFLEPYLPPLALPKGLSISQDTWSKFWEQREAWMAKRNEIVTTRELPHFGTIQEFERDGRKVLFVKTLAGGHDYLGVQEGVQDFVRIAFNSSYPLDERYYESHDIGDVSKDGTSSPADLPFNPSEYGLVHLPPLIVPPSPEENVVENMITKVPDKYPSAPAIDREPSVHSSLNVPGSDQSSTASGSSSEYFSGSSTTSEPHINFRFEHAQDENGNHVIVGREGILQRCEDEPICTPGAVQGFGVLIAVQEMEDALIVRQVSENSTELLGLSPRFLFSLECLTDTLPEPQADLLWDNIEYLCDSGSEIDCGPQVFLLSGWGAPGTGTRDSDNGRRSWTCWCAIHRPTVSSDPSSPTSDLIIMEFEWERDTLNPLYPPLPAGRGTSLSSSPSSIVSTSVTVDLGLNRETFISNHGPSGAPASDPMPSDTGLDGEAGWVPSTEDILESTTSYSKPLPALERLRRLKNSSAPFPTKEDPASSPPRRRSQRRRPKFGNVNIGVGMMDVFAVMNQMNEQLGSVDSLEMFLKVVVGVLKDLTQFHRVMVYQFDEAWNGQVVAELVDWSQTKDLYRGLHFPASDIPAQARALYAINKVRILYDRSQPTARIVVRSKEDLEVPLNMTHCYLRAMSPLHIKYLANMGVRASMSISIMAFGMLWGLITCHSYGPRGMRVSFAVRQMLRLLSQAISRNIERLSYAQRLHTRKMINTMTGYIVSNADDLLGLFDADFGILVIGEGAKILGPNQHGQEILIMAEYLRLKKFNTIQASQAVAKDFPDLQLSAGFQIIAGLLLVPLSSKGTDFIAFLRKGQPREVRWAGKPYKEGREAGSSLEPRKSFKTWSEIVAGRSRAWTDEQLETAGVLALVYGKAKVWRQKESALQTTKLTELLLSNASHEVRTPLNHIINYLEMALDGPLDTDARENLSRSHAASKSLLFTINDLLDLTRLESGKETSFNEPFDLRETIEKATHLYRKEAERRDIKFYLDLDGSPRTVIGDATKIRTVVQNLTANSLKYTTKGAITVSCTPFREPEGLRSPHQTAVEIVVADTGVGIPSQKLEHIFREFEQVESSEPKAAGYAGVGLGLAVVARIVEQLGGQLRVDSKVDEGSRFSFLIPLALSAGQVSPPASFPSSGPTEAGSIVHPRRRSSSNSEKFTSLVEAMVSSCNSAASSTNASKLVSEDLACDPYSRTSVEIVEGALRPMKAVKVDTFASEVNTMARRCPGTHLVTPMVLPTIERPQLRILIVEDNDINRMILAKRLVLDGHSVVTTTNGQEGLDKVQSDRAFDAILMDIQMPILNGFEATRKIREFEESSAKPPTRLSHQLNGRIPIFAVSASLFERQHDELLNYGMDGWILKPINFHRLGEILKGVTDYNQRRQDLYHPKGSWEAGGWLRK